MRFTTGSQGVTSIVGVVPTFCTERSQAPLVAS
jgi:hypothetical protein